MNNRGYSDRSDYPGQPAKQPAPERDGDQPVLNEEEQERAVNPQDEPVATESSADNTPQGNMQKNLPTVSEDGGSNNYDVINEDAGLAEHDDSSGSSPIVNP